jgi:hypothetical protein
MQVCINHINIFDFEMKKLTNIQRKIFIKSMIATSDKWALRALQVVYDNQTAEEQVRRTTKEHNGIGFTQADARLMAVFAQLLKTKGLTENQITQVKLKMPKYWKQILQASNIVKLDSIIQSKLKIA